MIADSGVESKLRCRCSKICGESCVLHSDFDRYRSLFGCVHSDQFSCTVSEQISKSIVKQYCNKITTPDWKNFDP